jgi:hypothetical protein
MATKIQTNSHILVNNGGKPVKKEGIKNEKFLLHIPQKYL